MQNTMINETETVAVAVTVTTPTTRNPKSARAAKKAAKKRQQAALRKEAASNDDCVSQDGESCCAKGMPTMAPPCDHNSWTRSRRRRVLPGARLRCLVCRALWVTELEQHEKCSGFYSGLCNGSCGKPHIYARGTVPKSVVPLDGALPDVQGRSLRQVLDEKPPKSKSTSEDDEDRDDFSTDEGTGSLLCASSELESSLMEEEDEEVEVDQDSSCCISVNEDSLGHSTPPTTPTSSPTPVNWYRHDPYGQTDAGLFVY